jgi:ubiquinone/menaquinone biosynthesis C-methylase UbiE
VDAETPSHTAGRPFAGDTATFYARYRREYPPELVSRLQEFSRVGRSRLLDLGCGTGQLGLQLARFFAQVVGMDPEADMLREAARAASKRNIGNIEWVRADSRDLPRLEPSLGRFDLVTIGTAFHLMEPGATLESLHRIAVGGGVAVAYNGSPMWLQSAPWANALHGALEDRLGPIGDADFTDEAIEACETTMRNLGYTQIERWERIYEETIDTDFVIGHMLSAISTAQIPATHRRAFAEEIRAALEAIAPSGRVTETIPVRAVIGRPPS